MHDVARTVWPLFPQELSFSPRRDVDTFFHDYSLGFNQHLTKIILSKSKRHLARRTSWPRGNLEATARLQNKRVGTYKTREKRNMLGLPSAKGVAERQQKSTTRLLNVTTCMPPLPDITVMELDDSLSSAGKPPAKIIHGLLAKKKKTWTEALS